MLCKVPNFLGKSTFQLKTNKPRGNFPEVGSPSDSEASPGSLQVAYVGKEVFSFPSHKWRSREIRAKLLPPQSPDGFSALALLYYLARPTKTAMLRRLHISRRHLRPKLRIARKCDGVFKKTEPQQTLKSLFSCLESSVEDT